MIGARIAQLRRHNQLSQQELADRLKISASAIGMYEQDRRMPPVDILAAMSEVFGVSIDYIVKGKGATELENEIIGNLLMERLTGTRKQLTRNFSRQELAVLLAALLMEP